MNIRRRYLTPPLLALMLLVLLAVPALALASAPWNGEPISAGLGPTYGESWVVPVPPTEAVSALQTPPLALIPYAAIAPTLDRFQDEAIAAGVPLRMTYSVMGKSEGGRDMYEVVINALETPGQQRDFARWQEVRRWALSDPAYAQTLLDSYGDDVKIPIYIDASIHGNEYEGVDAAMQIIRDLTVTPRGVNATVDDILDHAIVIISPCANPDGRVQGTRSNGAGIDMNRDYFVQSQPEVRHTVKLLQKWLPPAMLALHGYYTPTLIDGLTFPHNPGFEYDLFGSWNQRRTQANRADFAAAQRSVQIPVNDWGATYTRTIAASPTGATQSGTTVTITTTTPHGLSGGERVTITGVLDVRYRGTFTVTSVPGPTTFTYTNPTPSPVPASGGGTVNVNPGPALSDGWDDWGPFYGQSYAAFLGVDGSTVEMSNNATLGGRWNAKRDQYVAFYSSARFWVANRQAMMRDQLEIFRRGVTDADHDPLAFANSPLLSGLGFADDVHNWMYPYPKAYVIPFGAGQRSDAEANRLVRWLLDNGIHVTRMAEDVAWGGTTYPAGSYVVWMAQPLRGLAREALSAGVDISPRTSRLYASPAAWSLGLTWGADVVEVPRGDAAFAPMTSPVSDTNELTGGVRGGLGAPADWYSVTLRGVREFRAIMKLLNDGVRGEIAEAPFDSTTGGRMPAGTLVFPADSATKAALDAAGKKAGVWFERNVGVTRPPTTRVAEAPRVAVLRASMPAPYPPATASYGVMTRIFGAANVGYVITGPVTGTYSSWSLTSAATDPLLGYDFIWNEGAAWPADATARARLTAFFARGGGYFGDNGSAANYAFLSASGLTAPAIVQGSTTSANTYGGIHRWGNVGGENSPVSGAYAGTDYGFVPSRIWWFTTIPSGAVVDARYSPTMTSTGPDSGWVSGMWLNRHLSPGANDGVLLIRGATTAGSRYVAHSSDLTTRIYPERAWLMIGQAALWTNLTDEVTLDEGPGSQTVQYSDGVAPLTIGARDADTAGSALEATATGLPAGVTLTRVSDNGSTIPGAASWRVAGNVTGPAGTYNVKVTVGDAVRVTGSTSFTIKVAQEDASLLYNGSVVIPVGTKPTLGAQFWDSAAAGFPGSNPEPAGTIGDITRASVRFAVSSLSSPIGTAIAPVADTATLGDGIGSASALFASSSPSEAVWTVTATVAASDGTPNLYYTAPADTTGVVVFYQDTGQFATGGGTIPDGTKKANFGFVARYNRNGKPQGQVVYVFRGTHQGVDATFQIRSNALTGLAFSSTSYPISATLEGKATITIVDGNNTVLFSAGNWRFTASVTDTNVNPGNGSDRFAITVWDATNQLYKSVPSTLLSGGNITVKNPK